MVWRLGHEPHGAHELREKEEQIFLGREFGMHKDYSEETAKRIDAEIGQIVSASYDTAKRILSENLQILHNLSEELIKRKF